MISSDLNRREWLKLAGGVGVSSIALASQAAVAAGGRPRQSPVADLFYSQRVMSLGPVGYRRLSESRPRFREPGMRLDRHWQTPTFKQSFCVAFVGTTLAAAFSIGCDSN